MNNNYKLIIMAKDAKQRANARKAFFLDPIRDAIGINIDAEDVLVAKCYKNRKFDTLNGVRALSALEKKGVENIYIAAVSWAPVPTDWLDSDTPEPTTGKIEPKKTEHYVPFSENGHLIAKGEIKNERESVLKYLKAAVGDRARIVFIYDGQTINIDEEVANLPDAYKADKTLGYLGMSAPELWNLTDQIPNSAEGKKYRDWFFKIGAHAAILAEDVIPCPECGRLFRWHELSGWKYNDDNSYKGWGETPVLECPNTDCGALISREQKAAGKAFMDAERAKAWKLIEEHLAAANKPKLERTADGFVRRAKK